MAKIKWRILTQLLQPLYRFGKTLRWLIVLTLALLNVTYVCICAHMYLEDEHIQQQWRQTGRFWFATFLIPSTFGNVRARI